ncbi:MAG: Rieske 2Fe-2S domain-containing protein [Gluconobacter japonicus]|uniref:Rieske 2Fe-2S domain-containing protein n=1 Tax=Gluconobacter japonicus TaxID=376620 RepID=A0A9Q2FM99_GLUJA|nr:Rieske 2Fe-2S domain-containing protein [Gluconobacter japonicus]MBF0870996.1 Rieske 2Fe-2S domain-containing protein [Gluconobacter japonicus]
MTDWFPLALGMDVPSETAAPARLHGKEIALWRGADGQVHAWEDHCPHRGMRLSFGFVRNGNLACLYHGWQFGADAACRHIPAHPELRVPGTIHAHAYRAEERAGVIWVSLNEDESLDELPDMDAFGARSILVQAPLASVRAALALPEKGWEWQEDCLVAAHEPETGLTMLHMASATLANRLDIAARSKTTRDRLEALNEKVPA